MGLTPSFLTKESNMKKYVLIRLIKAIISILIVVSIVIVMVYKLIPISKVMQSDTAFQRLKGIARGTYQYNKLEQLGYMDYVSMADMCKFESDNVTMCLQQGSEEQNRVLDIYREKGYVIETLSEVDENDNYNTAIVGHYDYNPLELITRFYGRLLQVDNPWSVQDSNNPDLERTYYIGTDYNGIPALMCSGCTYKYQIYFDLSFPFIHQNIVHLNFGESYPTLSGVPTLEVINGGQGSVKNFMQTFPTGVEMNSPILQHSCAYKTNIDHIDEQKFTDHYADCDLAYDSPSMVETSYIFGVISLILAYLIAVPFGISMAQNKGKLIDKIGVAYINILIAVPSLAFIFFMKSIGQVFSLPDRFPQLGFGDIRSYIMPLLILALMSTPSLMMWIRRYMVDQSNADYVKFARAKGLSQKEIFRKHILKNAIIPIINGIPSSIILCISGAVITESVFSIPGMGKMLPDAISVCNNNMVITLTFIFTTLSVLSVLIGDLLMTVVDPRIQLSAKGGE